jgi:tRNA modification GTPase
VETIAAIATPMGHGGIGIVRISGSRAKKIVGRLFRPQGRSMPEAEGAAGRAFRSHFLHYGHIIDPLTANVIDEAMVVLMEAPRSYTREDVVEIQSHGGAVTLGLILELVLSQGARHAEAGEFTQRAFLNGRIDLSQAEAVADLINANSRNALLMASKQLGGELRVAIEHLVQQLTAMAADIEARIEFSDELETPLDRGHFTKALHRDILPVIERLHNSYQQGHLLYDGFKVAIAGRPNVGKSSLMNRLIGKDKAIVTPIAGTTRDIVEQSFTLNSLSVHLSDTAGLRCSSDEIEMVGIQKARECLADADMVLLVMDAVAPYLDEEAAILKEISPGKTVLVINKTDLLIHSTTKGGSPVFRGLPETRVSALTGEGIENLKSMIAARGSSIAGGPGNGTVIFRARHKQCLGEALDALQALINGMGAGDSEEFLSMDLQEAIKSLKKISGGGLDEDIIETIFRNFCIGK